MNFERASDPIDDASNTTMLFTEHALSAARAKAAPQQVKNEDGSWPHEDCNDCGLEIERGRLELGYITCVTCATKAERVYGSSGRY